MALAMERGREEEWRPRENKKFPGVPGGRAANRKITSKYERNLVELRVAGIKRGSRVPRGNRGSFQFRDGRCVRAYDRRITVTPGDSG